MNYFSRDSLTSSPHEKYGWLAIFGLFGFLGLFFLAGAGRFLVFLYPACSLAVGIYLFQYHPKLYILYAFWLWFLSGLIRRLIDYQSGEYTMGGFYTTPEFVTLISSLTFIRLFPKELKSIGLPFILCIGTVFYGTLIGIINNPLTDFSIVDFVLGFLCPIIFGFHLYSYWQEYPALSRSINKIFIDGVLVMGLYGIYQYVVAPAWDRFFLTLTELAARGTPEPFGIRVWSTTSAAHQLVFPLIPGILLSLCPPFNWTQYLALLFGSITLLASVVRTGWLCLLLVVTLYIVSIKPKQQSKILILLAVIFSLILVVILSVSQFNELVIQRFLTFQSLDSDEALNLRTETFSKLFANIVFDPIGKGFGFYLESISNISNGDGTFLPMLLWFGLIGTIIYFLGVFMIIAKIIKTEVPVSDNSLIIIKIICFGLMPMMFSGQYFPELPGLVVWAFLSLGLAAYKYYDHEKKHAFQK
jgi:hypothetical protein